MKNVTHSFVFLAHWPSAGSFGLNTDILATNLINLTVVVGRILSTIRNSEELRRGTIEQLEKARIRLQKANLINATSISLEQLEKSKNETLYFEKQRAMNQVRQRVFQQAVQGALGTLNSCLNTESHFRTIRANIGILGSLEWKR
ncbi:unnamed protein product [Triticum turgidum subsp. durum]|uniref:ATP synthase CF0 subunit I n=1 Tax=Triticum turgidum subsp. durum TaxID=4567 RepID=A0A9R1P7Y9_TRITD|nr:unnamed protein product [Triticum turgidum subsp. durum]